jgi:hypothetical protein
MNVTEHQVGPAQPSLIQALTAGFETVSSRIELIFFPVALDLLLWFGPRVRPVLLSEPSFTEAAGMTARGPETVRSVYEQTLLQIEQFNILSVLRAFPFGLPSLFALRTPERHPAGLALIQEISSYGLMIILVVLLVTAGLAAAALYGILISQSVRTGRVNWRQALTGWLWTTGQYILLLVAWHLLLIGAFLPLTCVISLLLMAGQSQFTIVFFVFGSVLLAVFFGLLAFAPHGILLKRRWAGSSLVDSIKIMLQHPLPTSGFLVLGGVLVLGTDLIWRIPAYDSWLTLVGVLGHAFITTSVLAASMVFYREADRLAQQRIEGQTTK